MPRDRPPASVPRLDRLWRSRGRVSVGCKGGLRVDPRCGAQHYQTPCQVGSCDGVRLDDEAGRGHRGDAFDRVQAGHLLLLIGKRLGSGRRSSLVVAASAMVAKEVLGLRRRTPDASTQRAMGRETAHRSFSGSSLGGLRVVTGRDAAPSVTRPPAVTFALVTAFHSIVDALPLQRSRRASDRAPRVDTS